MAWDTRTSGTYRVPIRKGISSRRLLSFLFRLDRERSKLLVRDAGRRTRRAASHRARTERSKTAGPYGLRGPWRLGPSPPVFRCGSVHAGLSLTSSERDPGGGGFENPGRRPILGRTKARLLRCVAADLLLRAIAKIVADTRTNDADTRTAGVTTIDAVTAVGTVLLVEAVVRGETRFSCETSRWTSGTRRRLGIRRAARATRSPCNLLTFDRQNSSRLRGHRPDEIRELFERYGPVRDVYLPKDYYTKEPRGFGFVEFKYPEDAGDAKHALDRMMFAGKELAVLFAQQGRKDPSEMTRRTERRSRSPPRGRRSRSPRGRSRSPRRRSPSPRRERSRSRSPRDSPRRASPTGWGDDSPRANKSPVERMPAESPRNEA